MSKKRSRNFAFEQDAQAREDYGRGINKKNYHVNDIKSIFPKTAVQRNLFEMYQESPALLLHGVAGTGKTFLAMYLGLSDTLSSESLYERLILVRSAAQVRDLGFMPGDEKEKLQYFEEPYKAICQELFPYSKTYENLKKIGKIEFISTSFLRGITFNDAIIIADEVENFTFQELDALITRVGKNSKLILCGDITQTDLDKKKNDQCGLGKFMQIAHIMPEFTCLEFGVEDVVRSGLVKSYILAKHKKGL